MLIYRKKGDSVRCNNCGAEISDNALFCRVCGVRISDSKALTNDEKTSEAAGEVYSPDGEAVPAGDKTPLNCNRADYPRSEAIPAGGGQGGVTDGIGEGCHDELNDYVNRSVLMTLVFGMIFGLIALFYALTARNCFEDGETENGIKKAKTARRLCRISLVFGIIKWLTIFAVGFLFIYIF